MTPHRLEPESNHSTAGILALLLLAIFTTELAVMESLKSLGFPFGRVLSGLVDAAILVLFLALPLWTFVIRPLHTGSSSSPDDRGSAMGPYLIMLVGIFLVEFIVDMTLPAIITGATYQTQSLIDASLTTMCCAPFLWWLIRRLKLRHRGVSLSVMLGPPLRLYLLLLLTIFLVDLLEEQLQSYISQSNPVFSSKLVNALASTLLIAPLLWMLVIAPLKKAARKESVRNRALQNQMIDAIVVIDSSGTIRNLNPAAERIFCCPMDQLLGQPIGQLFTEIQEIMAELLREAREQKPDQRPRVFPIRFANCRNGSTLYMDVTISKIMLEEQEEFLLLLRNLTARTLMQNALQESESRFRQMFDQSKDAIVLFSHATCSVQDANTTTEEMFGYTRKELMDSGLGRLGTLAEIARLNSIVCSVKRDRNAQREDIVLVRKDGTQIVVSMVCYLMTLQGADVVFCTFRDTTEQVRLRQETREIQAKLIQTNKMTSLGLLVSGVAHEINNPNNFVMTNSTILEEIWQDARKILQEYYDAHGDYTLGGTPFSELEALSPNLFAGIVVGSHRINEIVNNLKQFARQDRLEQDEDVDVNRVAMSAASILLYEINRFTDNFHLELAEVIPTIRGNSQQLGQVFINLLMNACQALSAREGGIWLSTGFAAGTNQVTITVRDEGCGMAPEIQAKIAVPFFTTRNDLGGTGLGLSISRSIVKDHRGTLEFVSEPGKGSTFVVAIPVGKPNAQEDGT